MRLHDDNMAPRPQCGFKPITFFTSKTLIHDHNSDPGPKKGSNAITRIYDKYGAAKRVSITKMSPLDTTWSENVVKIENRLELVDLNTFFYLKNMPKWALPGPFR